MLITRPGSSLDPEVVSEFFLPVSKPAFGCTVVVPFFNEAPGAAQFVSEMAEALAKLGEVVEVVLVDDGSADETANILEKEAASRPGWWVLRHQTNLGQAAALLNGMCAARSEVIVTLDGDGQNDPNDIANLLNRLRKSDRPDMVAGVRAKREDSWLRRRMSRIANGVRSRILKDGVRDTGCGLKAFRREVVGSFLPIRTLYSFMPALAVAAGFRVVEQSVNHRPRRAGISKYGLGVMLWRPLLDMLGVWWFTRRRFPIVEKGGVRCDS